MFKTKNNINVTIFNRDHSIGNGIESYTLALGADIADLVDFIIRKNDFNDEDQQQKLIDELILEAIAALVKATEDTIDDQYVNYLRTSSLHSIEKKRSHLLNYQIKRDTLRRCDFNKSMLYLRVDNAENEFVSYQKIYLNEKDILAFEIELDDDLRTKLENARENIKKFKDISECELLDLAISNSIEQRYVKTVKTPSRNVEHANDE